MPERSAPIRRARLTILSRPETEHSVDLEHVSGNDVRLLADVPVAAGEPVRLDLDDEMLLAEVSRCRPDAGVYRIQMRVEHCLRNLSSLSALVRRLQAAYEDSREPAETAGCRHSRSVA
jgi:hypothetical protein